MTIAFERQFSAVKVILDAEDAYARELGTHGRHPRPIGQVTFRILGTITAAGRQDFPEPLELVSVRNPSGYQLFFDTVRLPDGRTRRMDFPDGTYVLRAETPETRFYQHFERTDLTLPMGRGTPYRSDLLPGYGYPFPLPGTFRNGHGAGLIRGSFVNAQGEGIAEATVSIVPRPQIRVPGTPATFRDWLFGEYLVDDTGQFVLIAPDLREYPDPQPNLPAVNIAGEGTVDVRFTNGAVSTTVVAVPFTLGAETTLQQTSLRGSVLRNGIAVRGASVQVEGEATPAVTDEEGNWVYYFALNQPGLPPATVLLDVTATHPDGRTLRVPSFPVQPRATAWAPAFRFA